MGSSFAAGPALGRSAPGSPRQAGRSTRNYAHLVAQSLDLLLTDVTFSGATTADLLSPGSSGEPAQIESVGLDTRLVTVTCGGNDVGYIPTLASASTPRILHPHRLFHDPSRLATDSSAADRALDRLGPNLRELARQIRQRGPSATVLFVDYLSVLPCDPSIPTKPLSRAAADLGRHIAHGLAQVTRESAEAEDCIVIAASEASIDHHAWSADPWTNGRRFSLTGGAPFHPRRAGMRAVADLIVDRLSGNDSP